MATMIQNLPIIKEELARTPWLERIAKRLKQPWQGLDSEFYKEIILHLHQRAIKGKTKFEEFELCYIKKEFSGEIDKDYIDPTEYIRRLIDNLYGFEQKPWLVFTLLDHIYISKEMKKKQIRVDSALTTKVGSKTFSLPCFDQPYQEKRKLGITN